MTQAGGMLEAGMCDRSLVLSAQLMWSWAPSAEQDAAGERHCRYRSGRTFTGLTTEQRTALVRVLWAALHVVKSTSAFLGGILSDRIGRRGAGGDGRIASLGTPVGAYPTALTSTRRTG